MAEIRRCLTTSEALALVLANDLIADTETEQSIIEWGKIAK